MREMKDSGFGWLRDIPLDWDILKIKDGFVRKKAKALQNDPVVLSLARSGVKVRDISTNEGQLAASYYEYNPVTIDDMLLNPMDLQSGANCSISKVDGVISPAYINLRYKEGFNPTFYDYYFKYQYWSYAFFSYGKGVSFDNRWTLNEDTLMNLPLLVPSKKEQDRIAAYLDEQCKKIDEIMTDIQSQIDTLEDYKRSVISEAVTMGLNPNVEMKKTDMGWIKQVPAKWNISRIASVYELRNEKVSDNDYQPLSVTMKGVLPQLDTVAKSDAHDDRKLVRKGDFAINSRSDRRGSCGIAPCDGSISLINTVLCPLTNMNPIYYNWLFHTTEFADEFYKWGHGIVDDLWTTGWQEMKNILIPVPPVQEQEEIAKYLNEKCADINSIIEVKKAQLETIENYKKSLIYEYVTGKKEVPENE